MRTHVALLRGVNVAGHGKVPMAPLRELVTGLGCSDVASYIQSGNVVFRTTGSGAAIAADLERLVAAEFGVKTSLVVLTRAQLLRAIESNPYPDVPDPKRLHAIFRAEKFTAADTAAIAAAQQRAELKGSRDEATAVGATLYLHTPDGLGRSELAGQLTRARLFTGTARNWATVAKLAALLNE
jgi:uncharacterized protein (DUF1697 family)